MVKDSIDTRIQLMQQRKIEEINKAMEEGRRPKNLTTQELIELFADSETWQKILNDKGQHTGNEKGGNNGNSEDEPFIIPDDACDVDGKDDDVEMIDSN